MHNLSERQKYVALSSLASSERALGYDELIAKMTEVSIEEFNTKSSVETPKFLPSLITELVREDFAVMAAPDRWKITDRGARVLKRISSRIRPKSPA
ncbi:hypothetical protein SAMN05421688_1507 [Poseidonocella pacifica]|uniref:Mrr N-terminal domain-containing protein n=1 Tax=Poseidonocella pacifica TaxID=871651 RepID=A0A1I0WLT1_9RHOB|nr:hypothetical protein [Poseidonocella pacifica]SFA88963.1 hypothetical protein SAMN05421688_1507 [Poseidonocella pacifica]